MLPPIARAEIQRTPGMAWERLLVVHAATPTMMNTHSQARGSESRRRLRRTPAAINWAAARKAAHTMVRSRRSRHHSERTTPRPTKSSEAIRTVAVLPDESGSTPVIIPRPVTRVALAPIERHEFDSRLGQHGRRQSRHEFPSALTQVEIVDRE